MSSINVADPPFDISKVRAVIVDVPSLPLNIMSLSLTELSIVRLLLDILIVPTCVPASLNNTSLPAASKTISSALSIIIFSLAELAITRLSSPSSPIVWLSPKVILPAKVAPPAVFKPTPVELTSI